MQYKSAWKLPLHAKLVDSKRKSVDVSNMIHQSSSLNRHYSEQNDNILKNMKEKSITRNITNTPARDAIRQKRYQEKSRLIGDSSNINHIMEDSTMSSLSISLSTIRGNSQCKHASSSNELDFDRQLHASSSTLNRTVSSALSNFQQDNNHKPLSSEFNDYQSMKKIEKQSELKHHRVRNCNNVTIPESIKSTKYTICYCVYCGMKCFSVDSFSNHLQQCKVYHDLECHEESLTKDIKGAILDFWGTSNIQTERQKSSMSGDNGTEKTNVTGTTLNTTISEQVVSKSPARMSGSDIQQQRMDSNISYSTSSLSRHKPYQLKSVCPFCSKEFAGERLSRHLLRCHSRKKTRERRESSFRTPERTKRIEKVMTVGGRQLPGHPGIIRAPQTQ